LLAGVVKILLAKVSIAGCVIRHSHTADTNKRISRKGNTNFFYKNLKINYL